MTEKGPRSMFDVQFELEPGRRKRLGDCTAEDLWRIKELLEAGDPETIASAQRLQAVADERRSADAQ